MSEAVIAVEAAPSANGAAKPEEPNVLRLRLVRSEKPVEIEDAQGMVHTFTLREMVGLERDRWLNSMGDRVKVDGSGKMIGLRKFENMQASLITKCLYDQHGQLVQEKVISTWPSTAQKALFEMCKEMNGLNDEDEEKEKNA
jgi:hypothetical protein